MKKFWLTLLMSAIVAVVTSLIVVSSFKTSEGETYRYSDSSQRYGDNLKLSDEIPYFTYAAETSVEAVVHVKVVKRGARQAPSNILEYFFGYPSQPYEQVGTGSGVIITSDGYIVTNNHVIEGANEIEVTLDNNRTFKSKLVGTDPATDVALLKIDAENLPTIPMGDSDGLRLGEWVLAIGSPYDLRSTITAGIVGAKGRSMPSQGEFKIEAFIQTDAAVNPGNSGGALVNVKGELVGINTAIISRTGSFAGYSFAIPVNIVKKIAEDLIDFGSVKRALLGITMQDINDALAKEMKLSSLNGVYISQVSRKGAADLAGMKKGDVLIRIDSTIVNKGSEVQEKVNKYRPGDKALLTVMRDGRQIQLEVTFQGENDVVEASESSAMVLGATLENTQNGVEVVSVGRGKFLNAGIEEGFVITYVNQTPVTSVEDVVKIIKKSKRSVLIEGISPDGSVKYYGIGL